MRESSKRIWDRVALRASLAKEKDLTTVGSVTLTKPEPDLRWGSGNAAIVFIKSPKLQQRAVTHESRREKKIVPTLQTVPS